MGECCGKEIAGGCITGRVRALNRVVTGILDDALRPFGVRSSQMGILSAVAARGPVSPTEVSRAMHLERSTLCRDLDRLVARGWISSTPGPGRSLRLEITEPGRALLAELRPAWDKAQDETRALLGEALVAELFRAVDGGLAAVE